MQTYIIKRLLLTIPMLFGISIISMVVMQLAPGEVGGSGGGEGMQSSKITKDQRKIMERTFHLDMPMYKRYFYWLGLIQNEPTEGELKKAKIEAINKKLFGSTVIDRELTPEEFNSTAVTEAEINANIPKTGVLYGDFGNSMQYHSRKVTDMLAAAIPVTLLFNFLSFVIIYLLAIPLGIFSATHQDSKSDKAMTAGSFMLYSMPNFWVGLLLIKAVGLLPRALQLPIHDIQPPNSEQLTLLEWLASCSKYFVLPLMVFTFPGFAQLSRYMRSSMIDTIRSDYVRTARAKGLPEFWVIYKHALRNSLIPIITLLGSELPALFSGSVIVEELFGIPGMGKLAFDALLARDYTVLMADLVVAAVLVMVGFLVSDLLYKGADPRISFENESK